MEEKFLSVKEFAELAGVTVQAVYKRLNNEKKEELEQFVRKTDKRLEISSKAVVFFQNEGEKSSSTGCSTGSTTSSTTVDVNLLISTLQDELKAKNEQIRQLQNLLEHEQTLFLNYQKQLEAPKVEHQAIEQPQEQHKRSLWNRLFRK